MASLRPWSCSCRYSAIVCSRSPFNLVFVPFIDYGRSWYEADTDPGNPERNTDEPRYIVSSGIGALWQPLPGLSAEVYWGADIGNNFKMDDPRDFREEHDLQDDGVHFFLELCGEVVSHACTNCDGDIGICNQLRKR